ADVGRRGHQSAAHSGGVSQRGGAARGSARRGFDRRQRGGEMIVASSLKLPRADGTLEAYVVGAPAQWPERAAPPKSRVAFAAAHVVADPLATADPWLDAAIDWDATLAFRRHLWGLGFSIAE